MNWLIDDYARLFLSDVPMLDVRSPIEFARGAFPQAINRPLLNDEEREQVGQAYAREGNDLATALGHQLVRGAIKADRVSSWHAFADMYPGGCLYCFRGGQRSQIAQEWLYEDGVEYPRVRGGYKAMRRFLLETLERSAPRFHLMVLGGRTGVGKTEMLLELPHHVDLEGLANHRGSGFGRRVDPQPPQIGFENALAIQLLKLEHAGAGTLVIEDESRCIGARSIPEALWDALRSAPVVVLEDDLASRIVRTRREYVEDQCRDFLERYPEDGFERYAEHLRASLERIARRLGGERFQALKVLMNRALEQQRETGSCADHDAWIERMLVDYYDPMYDYQLRNKGERVRFVGQRKAVRDFLLRQLEQ